MIKREHSRNLVTLSENDIYARLNLQTLALSITDDPIAFREDPSDAYSTSDTAEGPVLDRRPAIRPLLFGAESPLADRPRLGRLTINISNACNLACSYCYADHGLYHAAKSLMADSPARAIVDRVVSMYGRIETVHLFGGEPLMNIGAFDAIGEAFEAATSDGRLAKMPRFVATTNGTLSGPRVIAALKRWGVALTISWDGPDAVHDRMRPTASGKPSSALLRRSIAAFAAAGIDFEFECTFSRAHIDAGISVVDLMGFFARETEDRVIHIAPAFLPDEAKQATDLASGIFDNHGDWQQWAVAMRDLVPQYRAAARLTVDNMFAGAGPMLEFAVRILEQVDARRPSATYCPAFFNQLSIAADGSVFPCFMFIGDDRFRLGNILTDSFPTDDSRRLFSRYFEEFGDGGTGSDDWYAPLASGCIAGDAIVTGSFGRRALGPIFEAMAEECLMGIGRHVSSHPDMEPGQPKETFNV